MITAFLIALLGCSDSNSDAKPEPTKTQVSKAAPTKTCGDREKHPDVLLLSIDTLRADHLGYAGYANARTPNLDALAARGHVFSQATTPVPRTTPALGSLLTGLAPHHHGAREVGEEMTATDTIAARLQTAGWHTIGVSAIRVAGPEQNLDRGFDSFDVLHDSPADELSSHALQRVKDAPPDCPLLLWIHYADPHFPYLPPPRWKDQPKAERCRALGRKATIGKLARYRLFANRNGMAEEVLDECTALYDAEIAFTDHGVGALFAGLKALDRADPIVAFTADHGENLGEWGLYFEHGPNAHDASLRVPLVMAGPGIPAGKSDGVARVEDITPTILAMVQPDANTGHMDGQSLIGQMGDQPGPAWVHAESGSLLHARIGGYLVSGRRHRLHCIDGPRFALCKQPKSAPMLFERSVDPDLQKNVITQHPAEAKMLEEAWRHWPVERTRQRVIRSGRFSLVAKPQLSGDYTVALYDHTLDPLLSTDVQAKHPAIRTAMEAELRSWHAELDSDQAPVEERSLEQEDALRSLGYIE
jgi:arylsulfatase A-like enzyme